MILAVISQVVTGLSIWKPTQFSGLVSLLGGFQWARVIHFAGMTVIVGFLVVHVLPALLVPQTLWAMRTMSCHDFHPPEAQTGGQSNSPNLSTRRGALHSPGQISAQITLSRRVDTLAVLGPRSGKAPVHLLVDSTGLKPCGAGEWLEKHGARTRRAGRKLHIGVDAGTGQALAATLTARDIGDASQVGCLLDQVTNLIASFTADGSARPGWRLCRRHDIQMPP